MKEPSNFNYAIRIPAPKTPEEIRGKEQETVQKMFGTFNTNKMDYQRDSRLFFFLLLTKKMKPKLIPNMRN